jgi:glucose-1-phosphate cytidylyltransferase
MIKDFFRNYLWHTCDVTLSLGRTPATEFHDRHDEENWSVTLADTGEGSMTAYRLKQIQRFIPQGEPFLLTYGDGLANIDIAASILAHQRSGKVCTLTAVHPAGRFGALRIEDDGRIQTFREKPQFEDAHVNGGFMVCEHRLFDFLPNDPTVMLEVQPMEKLVRDGQLNAYKHEGFWQPMDTYQETQYLNKLWAEGRAPWKIW